MPPSTSSTEKQLQPNACLQLVYQHHQQWLLKHLLQKLGNITDAEDVCQRIFLRLCEKPELSDGVYNPHGIFIGHRLHGLTGQQLAQRYNVSITTVRNHLRSASNALVQCRQ